MDLQLSRSHILRYWAGTPDQHRQPNRLYRRMRIGAAQRELSRNNGERFLAPGYVAVQTGSVATTTRCFLREPTFGKRETMGYGGLETSARTLPRTRYTWSAFWTTRDGLNFLYPRARYMNSTGAVRGSWFLHVDIASAFPRGIQRNVDEFRGAAMAS